MEVIIGDGEKLITLQNTNTNEHVIIDSSRGAATISLKLLQNSSNNLVSVLKTEGERFPGSMLVPWPNRIEDGKYTFTHKREHNGKKEEKTQNYTVDINEPKPRNTALHGLIENQELEIKHFSSDALKAWVVLKCRFRSEDGLEADDTIECPKGYPFDVEVEIQYTLYNSQDVDEDDVPEEDRGKERRVGLEIEVSATNLDLGEEAWDVPFAVGWHPYFWFGEDSNETLDQWNLTLPAVQKVVVNDRLIPTGTEQFTSYKHQSLKDHKYDTGFIFDNKSAAESSMPSPSDFTSFTSTKHKTILESPGKNAKIIIWQDKDKYDYFQIFTPDNRKSIALEPMSAVTNAFNKSFPQENQNKIRVLNGDTWVGSFGVILD